MANVLLNWTAPSDTNNIDGIVILKKTVSAGATAPTCTDFIAADQVRSSTASDIVSDGTVSQVGTDLGKDVVTVTETGVTAGSYYYAAFSYNAAGYSPCDVTDSELVIS